MLRLSWATFTERWPLFIGAALTVCLGVALVQSSLLVLLSAATLDVPAGLSVAARAAFTQSTTVAITVSSLTLGFSTFLAVFIVGSTFAFTVAQRRRDLALLRLTGGSSGQLHRLLVGEALLLGGVGTALGIPLGLPVMTLQTNLLTTLGIAPGGLTAGWRPWILGVSVGVGLGVAFAGVLVAARRAAHVRPLEALRDTGAAARVMTAGRWVAGLVFAAGSVALFVLAPIGGPSGGPALAINGALCLSVACSAFSPLLVPAVAALLPTGGVLGTLASANIRDGVRRSAATAAPLIVLVALVVSQAGTLTSYAAAGNADQRRTTAADLVVEGTGPVGLRIAAVPGVAAVDTEIQVPIVVISGRKLKERTGQGLVVDPDAYLRAHPGSASLATIGGRNVVAGPGGEGGSPGDRVGLRVGDTDLGQVNVVAEQSGGTGGGPDQLLPTGLVPDSELAAAPSRTFVSLRPGADATAVTAVLAAIGQVRTVEDWIARDTARRDTTNVSIFVVVMGLGAIYALIGVINAVVIGAAARRPEFAAARATGLTRSQVVRMALVESWTVTFIGLLLGGLVAAATFVAVAASTASLTGTAVVVVPWTVVLAVVAVAVVATGLTSVITTWSGTRQRPVTLLGTGQ